MGSTVDLLITSALSLFHRPFRAFQEPLNWQCLFILRFSIFPVVRLGYSQTMSRGPGQVWRSSKLLPHQSTADRMMKSRIFERSVLTKELHNMAFGLSILDVSPVSSGSSGAQALRNTRAGQAGRQARLRALLAGRAPQPADHRKLSPRLKS